MTDRIAEVLTVHLPVRPSERVDCCGASVSGKLWAAHVAHLIGELLTDTEEQLWDLIENWRDQADEPPGPFLSYEPRIAHAQGLNSAAEDLSDFILDVLDAGGSEVSS